MSTKEILVGAFKDKPTLKITEVAKILDKNGRASSPNSIFMVISTLRNDGHKITTIRKGKMAVAYTYEGATSEGEKNIKQTRKRNVERSAVSIARAQLLAIAQDLTAMKRRTRETLRTLPKVRAAA